MLGKCAPKFLLLMRMQTPRSSIDQDQRACLINAAMYRPKVVQLIISLVNLLLSQVSDSEMVLHHVIKVLKNVPCRSGQIHET